MDLGFRAATRRIAPLMASIVVVTMVTACSNQAPTEVVQLVSVEKSGLVAAIEPSENYEKPCLVARTELETGGLAKSWCDESEYRWLATSDSLAGTSFVAMQFAPDLEVVSITAVNPIEKLDFVAESSDSWGVALAITGNNELFEIELRDRRGETFFVDLQKGESATGLRGLARNFVRKRLGGLGLMVVDSVEEVA